MCLLHTVKLVCLNVMLFNDEVKNLCRMFLQNSNPNYVFHLTLRKFKDMAKQKLRTNDNKEFFVRNQHYIFWKFAT